MAQTPGSDDGTLNGITAVTLIAAPGASTYRHNLLCTIINRDTAAVTVTLQKVSGGGTRRISTTTLDVNDTLVFDDTLILDDTSSSLQAVMSGAPATTQPDWTSNWFDEA